MGARTEWLPAEHFMNINNWDDSLKPSASHYIQQVEEWIASKDGLAEVVETKKIPDAGVIKEEQEVNLSNPTDAVITNQIADMSKLPTQSREKAFVCSQCGKAFARKTDLTIHLRVHSGKKPIACTQCGKAFARRYDLTQHLRIHSGEKPFACSQCGKAFSLKSNLINHLRTHSGEKPFACSQCGKAFTQKGHLTDHLRTHSGEKPFRCEKCGKFFGYMSSRNVHMKRCNK